MSEEQRPTSATHIAVREEGVDRVVALPLLLQELGATVAIRLQERDFAQLMMVRSCLTHFNLGQSDVPPGARCVLLPIVCAGHCDQHGDEVLPVVDPKRARFATCINTTTGLTAETVTAEQFAVSLPRIRSSFALQAALLQRYQPQFPNLSDEEILGQGCTATLLRLETAN